MSVEIRRIRESDYEAVRSIWNDVLDVTVTYEQIRETYSAMDGDDRYCTFVADAEGVIAGLVTGVHVLAVGHPGGYIKMNGLGVLPEYRGRGLGRRVMSEAEDWLCELGYRRAAVESRDVAIEFYRHLGYAVTDPDILHGDTFDCVRMEKDLTSFSDRDR